MEAVSNVVLRQPHLGARQISARSVVLGGVRRIIYDEPQNGGKKRPIKIEIRKDFYLITVSIIFLEI